MDWQEASAYYEAKLIDILNLQRYALSLAELPQTGISEEEKSILINEAIPARKQLERLKRREFRISVVGLEKAGKSTFVNAWLDCDLLPSKGGRCTFTTTQIFSVQNDSQQVLSVKAKSPAQFSQLKDELRLASDDNEEAKKDLETINRYATTLQQVIDEGDQSISFSRLDDIKDPLRKYVADERFAHAVHEVGLHTNKLAEAEGIVFYDVPGLDSGLAKHIEESKEMLSDCDAVIVIQRFANIRGAEFQIIRFTEQGDRNIDVADKLFVFLSNIDLQGSKSAMEEHIAAATADWASSAKLPNRRIVSGTAGSHLVLSGRASDQTIMEVGQPDIVQERLARLTGISDRNQLISQVTGIEEIKSRVNTYINTERVGVLKKRCEASISNILSTAEDIRKTVSRRYSDNPEDAKRQEEAGKRISFTEWWEGKWDRIVVELSDYYNSKIKGLSFSQEEFEQSSIKDDFRNRYLSHVDELLKPFRERAVVQREIIFKKRYVDEFDSMQANYDWREALYIDIGKVLDEISKELAIELRKESLDLVDYISSLMWNSNEVKLRLIEDAEDYVEDLNRSLRVLFLRFARPMVKALVLGPVDSQLRSSTIKRLGPDIEILDNYYSGERKEYRVLKQVANHGMKLLYNASVRERVLGSGIQEVIEKIVDSVSTPERLLIQEVEADLNAVEVYLKQAIFEAAGFKQYYDQEMERLRDKFINSKPAWNGVAMNEWVGENVQLLSELPDELRKHEVNLEVSDRLRQLTIALEKIDRQSINH